MAGDVPGSVSGPADGFGLSGQVVEYRMQPQYRKPVLARFIASAAATVGLAATAANGVAILGVAAIITATMAVGYGVTYVWRRRFRTRVTGRGIDVRGYFNHFIPWQDVRGIEVAGYGPANATLDDSFHAGGSGQLPPQSAGPSMLGRGYSGPSGNSSDRMARLATIKVVRANGQKVLLRAPLVTAWASDPSFNDKARQLQALCQQHAGPAFGQEPARYSAAAGAVPR